MVKGEGQKKGSEFRVQRRRVKCSGPFERGIRIAECGIEEQGQKIEGSGFRVQGSGLKTSKEKGGSGFRVQRLIGLSY